MRQLRPHLRALYPDAIRLVSSNLLGSALFLEKDISGDIIRMIADSLQVADGIQEDDAVRRCTETLIQAADMIRAELLLIVVHFLFQLLHQLHIIGAELLSAR